MRNILIRNLLLLACSLVVAGCGEDTDVESDNGDESLAMEQTVGTPEESAPEQSDDGDLAGSANENTEMEAVEPEEAPVKNIAEILETDPRFSNVLELVNLIGLLDVMRSPGPFTIFLPTNEAIDGLPGDVMERVRGEQEYLHKFILAHVAEGDLASTDLVGGEDVQMIGGAVLVNIADDGAVTVGGAPVTEADVPASNGRLHILSGVIPIPTAEPVE